MPFVPVPETLNLLNRATLFGQDIETSLWFKQVGAPTAEDLQNACEAFQSAFTASVLPYLSSELVMREVYAYDATTSVGATYTLPYDSGTTGGALGGSMPGNVAFVIAFKTAFRGRSARGRVYNAAIPRALVTDNSVSGTFAANLRAAWENVGSVMAGEDFIHVVASRVSGGVPRENGVTFPVTSYTFTNLVVDSQRRRLDGAGV